MAERRPNVLVLMSNVAAEQPYATRRARLRSLLAAEVADVFPATAAEFGVVAETGGDTWLPIGRRKDAVRRTDRRGEVADR